jgi:hypothetical protein
MTLSSTEHVQETKEISAERDRVNSLPDALV